MSYLRLTDKIFLILLSCLFNFKGTSTQEDHLISFTNNRNIQRTVKRFVISVRRVI
ncbi:hypothetical protein HOLleu_03953 [Holothuria leucospilota]|uniref:Uncharacterized protein n=1 Tax=Holothuria leucospilota TaxID=206669 RepID=A0A9Q1CSA4_HOLLE|nr:hypothetical protein HOLleu_03953 [Holothuria leucospilota]